MDEQGFTREILDRCIKAEVENGMLLKREHTLLNTIRNAIRAKSASKRLEILTLGISAWDAML